MKNKNIFFLLKQVEFRESGAHQVDHHSVQEKSLKSGGKNLLVICRSDAAAKLFNLEDNLVPCFVFLFELRPESRPVKEKVGYSLTLVAQTTMMTSRKLAH